MKLEHSKRAKAPIRLCSVAKQVELLSLLRVLELKGTRSSPHPGLCQPRSSPETQASYWGFYRYLVRASAHHQSWF